MQGQGPGIDIDARAGDAVVAAAEDLPAFHRPEVGDIGNDTEGGGIAPVVATDGAGVDGVEVACAIKTYPDGKLTGKLRCNTPVAADIAGFFGGGGHSYAAGFKIYDSYSKAINELIEATHKALGEHHDAHAT